ncbi:glycosyltransferase family 2 protein [Candidatus Pelagibacter sp.]|nr:glycosyltransferase family 2 protein [Candidatus Pelagibacter sp.]
MSPLISIIMNCRNGEKFLNQSINSVINQTYKNWELIFVDNKSEDNSKKIFSNFENKKMKYINTQHKVNLGAARQIALENCSGEYIAFLDTDDLWFKKKLEKQIKFFDNKNVGMVISNTIFFSETREKVFLKKTPPTGFVLSKLLNNYFISLETLICKKEFINQISFKFNNQFTLISDLDLTIRLSKICKLEYCPEILSKWRVHENSETWVKKEKFFEEKLKLASILESENFFIDNNMIKNFKNNIYISKIINFIEKGESKKNLIKELKNISKKNIKFFLVAIIVIIPFNKFLLKTYRYFFDIIPK